MIKFELNYHLTNEEAKRRVEMICNLKNYTFLGFCDAKGNECNYKNNQTLLKLKCNRCNEIWTSTTYNRFMCGSNCPNCKKVLKTQYMPKIKQICQDRNYEFLNFCDKNGNEIKWKGVTHTYLKLKCNNCGNIWCTCSYDNFIRGRKCPKCPTLNQKKSNEKLLQKCKNNNWEILGYLDMKKQNCLWYNAKYVKLKCLVCNHVWNKLISSFHGKSGCPECSKIKNGKKRMKSEEESLKIIKNMCYKRNYEFLNFCDKQGNNCQWHGISTYLKLKCNNCGNIWTTCTYENFTRLSRGCPKCKQSKLEFKIDTLLKENNIIFETQKRFDWLKYQRLDFYIPSKNIAIECQGKQHFEETGWIKDKIKSKKNFADTKKRDLKKYKLCKENGVILLYFSNLNIEYPYEVITDENILLQIILGG